MENGYKLKHKQGVPNANYTDIKLSVSTVQRLKNYYHTSHNEREQSNTWDEYMNWILDKCETETKVISD